MKGTQNGHTRYECKYNVDTKIEASDFSRKGKILFEPTFLSMRILCVDSRKEVRLRGKAKVKADIALLSLVHNTKDRLTKKLYEFLQTVQALAWYQSIVCFYYLIFSKNFLLSLLI